MEGWQTKVKHRKMSEILMFMDMVKGVQSTSLLFSQFSFLVKAPSYPCSNCPIKSLDNLPIF